MTKTVFLLSLYGGLKPKVFHSTKLLDVRTLNGAGLCWSYQLGVIVDQYVTLGIKQSQHVEKGVVNNATRGETELEHTLSASNMCSSKRSNR